MQKKDFYFDLPQEQIALYPSEQRSGCKMLCLESNSGVLEDKHFYDLYDLIDEGDLLVFNDTKVIPARFYGKKQTGGAVELLIERILTPNRALAHIKASKAPKAGSIIILDQGYSISVNGREGALFDIQINEQIGFLDLLDKIGHIPLPPYIQREDQNIDKDRYQTVYSKNPGAVAAPTAGLHFDENLIERLKNKGVNIAFVTLHVGAGTFQPVREDDILKHHMHKEYVQLSKEVANLVIQTKAKGKRVIAVGTTSVRSLESAASYAQDHNLGLIDEFYNDTSIFIYPTYKYKVVDCLITNFHLPESTLIMLVCAFAGYKKTMNAYKHAVDNKYMFFSYGDSMFITKNDNALEDLPPL